MFLLLVSLLQAFGGFWRLETGVVHGVRALAPGLLPEPPSVLLVSLQSTPQGFATMDAAMLLRALGELHPRCVTVYGTITPEEGAISFLPGILSRLAEEDIQVIIPRSTASKDGSEGFESVPLTRYSLTHLVTDWPLRAGQAVPGKGYAFLPENSSADADLPLLASVADGSTIGSLWWWSLPNELRRNIFLLSGSILLMGNNTPLHLNPNGGISLNSSESVKEIPLDDFLLQIEQREQGTISPSFDSLWVNSTVVVASHDDLPRVSAFAALLKETSFRHFSVWLQLIMIPGWCIIFLLLLNCRIHFPSIPIWLLPIVIIITLLLVALLMLHIGIIVPLFPGLMIALLLLIN